MLAFLSSLWARIAGIGAAVLAVLAAVWWIRRDARNDALRDVQHETDRRELQDRRIVDDVEADVAGLDARERRERLRRYSRN
jgi:type VI protein secretion system component VasK